MSELIIEVSDATLDHQVLGADGPVLLDLWAPWCAPCRALGPVLKQLSTEYQGSLLIAKVDVEKYPDVQQRFGVRGIPTMLLFRDGEETSRAVGSKSSAEMRRWLASQGILASEHAPLTPIAALDKPRWGAFYGDAELREFLLARLRQRAQAGHVRSSRMPYWVDGVGTISAALVGGTEPRIFEGLTGMPASFACVLEFCVSDDLRAEDVDVLLGSIPLGADLRSVAPSMVLRLFDGELGDWAPILDDDVLNTMRLRWINLVTRSLTGSEVKRTEWQALAGELDALLSKDSAPERTVHDAVISALTALSPLPHADDAASWARPLLLIGKYLQYVLAARRVGWTTEDFALERFRDNWFTTRQAQEADGRFSDDSLMAARAQWLHEHGDRQRRYDAFFEKSAEHMSPVAAKVLACLATLVSQAPQVALE